ncbi:hypothetical protein [Enterococcus songbeiensis]|uniref:hypothetical protein n=1 Tax=Enterococcus songbeiensis TaxID=2559927 RepID=UPI0010F44F45|nr:hypothetical protein [Enterococcus songbeiensis]
MADFSYIFQEDNPEHFLTEIFDKETRIYLNSSVKIGYQLAIDTLKKEDSWLNDLRGKEILPRLKTFGVEYMIVQYIRNGLLNLNYSINYTPGKNNTFLLFKDKLDKTDLIVNQSNSPARPSRYAKYRENRYNNFETYFDFDKKIFVEEKPVYVELNHGYQTDVPIFTVLGIPKDSKTWYTSIPVDKEFELLTDNKAKFITTEKEMSDFNFDDFEKHIKESDAQ